jgi:hypothetical protein
MSAGLPVSASRRREGTGVRIVFLGNFAAFWTSETYWAQSLEDLGHEVDRLQLGAASEEILKRGRAAEVLVWVHTPGGVTPGALSMEQVLGELRAAGVPSVSYHLDLWTGLQRAEQVRREPVYRHVDHFFSVDPGLVEYLNRETPVQGHYLPAGVYRGECVMADPRPEGYLHDVGFVGGRRDYPAEWPYRPVLVDWLEETYGDGFAHRGAESPQGPVFGEGLNRFYADTKVIIGDSLCPGFDYTGYWSDRVYETIGRGGFLIHPYVPGLEEHFTDGRHLAFYTYGDFDELHELIDYYVMHDAEREKIRRAGFEHVREHHTYGHRWQTILDTVAGVRTPSARTGGSAEVPVTGNEVIFAAQPSRHGR